ncbi:MAG: c-type cytochrome [Planctomycetes bacterium]|nr:c-type cytochrome [Planctomycetota bacterium]
MPCAPSPDRPARGPAALALLLLLVLACDQGGGVVITDGDRRSARSHFDEYCSTCHGEGGKGDGPAGIGLKPRPRNWTDREWQESVSDRRIRDVIREGGVPAGLSAEMKPNVEFAEEPGVIAALAEIVRGFRR